MTELFEGLPQPVTGMELAAHVGPRLDAPAQLQATDLAIGQLANAAHLPPTSA